MSKPAPYKTTEFLLKEWSHWAGTGEDRLGYSASADLSSRPGRAPQITDDEAMIVENAIVRLQFAHPRHHKAIVDHYVRRLTYRAAAKEQGVHHRKISDLVREGQMWIAGSMAKK